MANKGRKDDIQGAEVNSLQQTLATFEFKHTKKELECVLEWRTAGLAHKSSVWFIKASEVLWKHTKGTISKASLDALRSFLLKKYDDCYAQSKLLNFKKGFLKYQAKLTRNPRYLAFDRFFEEPQVRKAKKKMTTRVVTQEGIEHVLAVIKEHALKGSIDQNAPRRVRGSSSSARLPGSVLTARSLSYGSKSFRDALQHEKPCCALSQLKTRSGWNATSRCADSLRA